MAKAASEEVRKAARALRIDLLRDLGRFEEADRLASQPLLAPAEASTPEPPQIDTEVLDRAVQAAFDRQRSRSSAFSRRSTGAFYQVPTSGFPVDFRMFRANPLMIESSHGPWHAGQHLDTFSVLLVNASQAQVARLVQDVAHDQEVNVIDLLDEAATRPPRRGAIEGLRE